jgi:hypothetical protein
MKTQKRKNADDVTFGRLARTAPVIPTPETKYLIELTVRGYVPLWWKAKGEWTSVAEEAHAFNTREEADVGFSKVGNPRAFVTEHLFVSG